MATMVSSRLTDGFSSCTSFCRWEEWFCEALTERSALSSSVLKPLPWASAFAAVWSGGRSDRRRQRRVRSRYEDGGPWWVPDGDLKMAQS
jgi:hypothetical protein